MSSDEELITLLDKISEARGRNQKTRLVITVLVLLSFVIFGVNTYQKINSFDTTKLMAKLQDNAAHKVWPEVHYELNSIGDQVIPVIADSLEKELQSIGPNFSEKFNEEARVLETNLSNYLNQSLQRELNLRFKKNKDRFEKKYADALNAASLSEELVPRLQEKSQQWAHQKLDTIFQDHINTLQSLNETVQGLQKEATRNSDGTLKKASMDDLILITSEILQTRIGDK